MILDRKTNTVPTIDDALKLVEKKGDTFDSLQIKGLGLRLVLLGLAEVQALRMSRLAGMVYRIEEKLLTEDTLEKLEPKQLFSLYNMSTRALVESSEYVERTLKGVDWSEIEAQLMTAKGADLKSEANADGNLKDVSEDLLAVLARAQAEAGSQGIS
jgi:hypothetical protein